LAANQLSPARQTTFGIGWLSWAAYHLLSLEMLLVMFLYGRYLKNIMPALPVAETMFYGALSVAVGIWVIARDGIYRRGLPIVAAGLAFSGWMFAAYGWSPSTVLARESLVFVLGINLWALFAAACIVAGSRERVMRLLLLIVLVTAGIAFTGAYIEIVHGSFRFYRGAAGNWEPRTYLIWGSIVSTGAAIAMAIAIHSRLGSLKQLAAATILCVSFFFVMTSGARGASLAIVTAALVALFVHRPRFNGDRIEIPKTQILVLAIVALLVGYVTYLLVTGQSTSTLGRLLRLFDQADDPLLRRGANRFDYFAGAYRAWLDSPLLGQGLYGFAIFFCRFEQPGCYPHNAILHVLADFGIVGLVLFLAFAIAGLRHLGFSRLRRDPLMLTLAMAFATVFFHVMVASDTTTYYPLFFFLGLLALRPPPDADEDTMVDDPNPD
jgi:O-antigen ligase